MSRLRAEPSAKADLGCYRAALAATRAAKQWQPAQGLIEHAHADGVQITGGTCGKVCGACGHTNDTYLLRTNDGSTTTACRLFVARVA